MQQLNYIYVKEKIELIPGYKVISNVYKGIHAKIEIKCPDGHIFSMSYGSFSQGHRCPVCQRKERANKKRNTYEYVKTKVESIMGYTLISKNYKGNKIKIEIKCPVGHNFEMIYGNFISKGQRCPICWSLRKNKEKMLSYDDIKAMVESVSGYKLISLNYKPKEKIEIECPKGHKFEVVYGNFYVRKRCPICWKKDKESSEEKSIAKYIHNTYNGIVIENDRTQLINPITGYALELDVWLPEINKAIEYNGTYWHQGRENMDNLKQNLCKSKEIQLLIIKESEWMKHKNYNIIDKFIKGV